MKTRQPSHFSDASYLNISENIFKVPSWYTSSKYERYLLTILAFLLWRNSAEFIFSEVLDCAEALSWTSIALGSSHKTLFHVALNPVLAVHREARIVSGYVGFQSRMSL